MTTFTIQRPKSVPWLRMIVGFMLLGLVVAAAALYAQNSNLSSRITRLQDTTGTQAQLASQAESIKAQASSIQTLQATLATTSSASTTLSDQVAAMSDLTKPKSFMAQLHVIYNCIPQLETQVNGISLAGTIAYPYIQNNTQVSRDCSSFLYGAQTTSGP